MSKWSETLAGVGTGILQAYEQDYQRKTALKDKMDFSAFEHSQRMELEKHRHDLDMIAKGQEADRQDIRAYNLASMATERDIKLNEMTTARIKMQQGMINDRLDKQHQIQVDEKAATSAASYANTRLDQMMSDVNHMLGRGKTSGGGMRVDGEFASASDTTIKTLGDLYSVLGQEAAKAREAGDKEKEDRIDQIIVRITSWEQLIQARSFPDTATVDEMFKEAWGSFDKTSLGGDITNPSTISGQMDRRPLDDFNKG